jgi:hypothetical protein
VLVAPPLDGMEAIRDQLRAQEEAAVWKQEAWGSAPSGGRARTSLPLLQRTDPPEVAARNQSERASGLQHKSKVPEVEVIAKQSSVPTADGWSALLRRVDPWEGRKRGQKSGHKKTLDSWNGMESH